MHRGTEETAKRMPRLLICVLVAFMAAARASAAPLTTGRALDGPVCKSPANPDETVDCAVLLQMAYMMLNEYTEGMLAYEERRREEQARVTQIGGNNDCKVKEVVSWNPYREICVEQG
jgi:hypothetical protein